MIYRRRRGRPGLPGGFFTFQDAQNHVFSGPGYGDHIKYPDPPEWAMVKFAERYMVTAPAASDDSVEALFQKGVLP